MSLNGFLFLKHATDPWQCIEVQQPAKLCKSVNPYYIAMFYKCCLILCKLVGKIDPRFQRVQCEGGILGSKYLFFFSLFITISQQCKS